MTSPSPQPLTEDELQAILDRTTRVMDDEYIDTDGAYYSAMDVPKLLAEVSRLRAENTAQAAKLDAVQTLRGRWAAVTKAEVTPSWDISRHHEHLAAYDQLQHCAQQLGDVIKAVGELQGRWNAATAPPPALGLDQDGEGNE